MNAMSETQRAAIFEAEIQEAEVLFHDEEYVRILRLLLGVPKTDRKCDLGK